MDLARKFAIDNCRSTAADQAAASVNIQSMSVETEKAVSFHQEVSSNRQVTNLICQPEKEYFEEVDSRYKVWIRCRFDLSAAKLTEIKDIKNNSDKNLKENINTGIVVDRESISSKISGSNLNIQQKKYHTSDKKQLLLATIPKCENLLIRGELPRSHQCIDNPQVVIINPGDTEVIIRGPSGYAPKHIKLKGKDNWSDQKGTETLEIYLEKM